MPADETPQDADPRRAPAARPAPQHGTDPTTAEIERPPAGLPARTPLPPEADLERLTELMWYGSEAFYVVDSDLVIEAWNPACETIWGITAEEAIGRNFEDLVDWEPIAGTGRDAATLALEGGRWQGWTLDQPKVGARAGETIFVDVDTRTDHSADGRIRYFAITREVTRSVRFAEELAPLGAIATSSGAVRDRPAVAEHALEILTRATGAAGGAVAVFEGGRFAIIAESGDGGLADFFGAIDPTTSPLIGRLSDRTRIFSGDPAHMPLRPDTRAFLVGRGVRWIAVTGLWLGDRLGGVIAIGWSRDLPAVAPEPFILQAAAHLTAALENARLVEELGERYDAAQALSVRLEALIELARLPESGDLVTLARNVVRLLVSTLGAAAGRAWQFDEDRWQPIVDTGLHPAFVEGPFVEGPFVEGPYEPPPGWLTQPDSPIEPGSVGPYLRPFGPGLASDANLAAARQAGYGSRAVFPIHDDQRLVGVVVLYFSVDRSVVLDERTLESIGRAVSAAFANLRLRERLGRAVTSEHRLASGYQALFRYAPNPLIVATPGGALLDANPAAQSLFGASRDDLVARPASTLIAAPADGAAHAAEWWIPGPPHRTIGTRRDARSFPVEVTSVPYETEEGSRLLIHVRDLSDEERLQGELVQAQKMDAIGQLVAGVAHELNNPIAAIIGFSQTIRREPSLSAEVRDDAELLVREAARTKKIVEGLLNFARPRPPERVPTKVSVLVQSVVDLQSYAFAGDIIDLQVDVPEDLPAVPIDRPQMQQVLINLIQNAIHAIRAHRGRGHIRIDAGLATREDGASTVQLRVSDDGPGVAEANRDRLFLPFFTTKEPGEGTGLGLSVSFGLVSGHGGRLSYQPRKGGGSDFIIELPLQPVTNEAPVIAGWPSPTAALTAAPPPAQPAGQAAASSVGLHARVLVLDDEEAIRLVVRRALRLPGVKTVLVADGAAAIAAIEAGRFDAMLCDHRMPGMTGTDVYDRVAELQPDLARHFVLMSGDVLNEHLVEFATARGIRLVAKPFDLETLNDTIRQTLADSVAPAG